jgi:hypothetical protein
VAAPLLTAESTPDALADIVRERAAAGAAAIVPAAR